MLTQNLNQKRDYHLFDTCEICHGPIKGVAKWFVDGATKQGPWAWALMCPQCFELYGVSIRYGLGQKYDGNTGVLLDGGRVQSRTGLRDE